MGCNACLLYTSPSAQVEDLNLIRNEWGKIVREMGMSIRPSFRDTVVEPSGDSCLCIVFSNAANYAIGSRPSVLGAVSYTHLIGGVLTFKNAKKLKEVAEYAPIDRIVLETDCPYMAPTPNRGKRNSSLNLPYVADELALSLIHIWLGKDKTWIITGL